METNRLSHLHKFEVWGEQLVLHIPESRVYKINHPMARVIDLLGEGQTGREIIDNLGTQYPREKVAGTLQTLGETGLLTGKRETVFEPPENPPLDTLDIQVSHLCNLGCKYCYAKGGNFGGQDKLMSAETGKKAIDFFLDQVDGKDELCISFDGGEPLINFNVIREITLYAREKEKKHRKTIQVNIGTNATLVTDEVAAFFSEHRFSPQISLDGEERIHNRLRPFKNDKGSYGELMEGVKRFRENGVKLASRITLTPANLNLKDTVERLHNLGAIRIAAFPATGIPGEYAFRASDLDTLKEEYDKTAEYFLDTLFKTGKMVCFSNFTDNIQGLHKAKILHYGCGAARTFVSVDPHEDLYPCHRLVGNRKYRLGNLQEGMDRNKRRIFLENHVESKEKCRGCWARYLCGGGCLVEAEYAAGDIKIPYDVSCEIFKYERELSMMIYSKICSRDKSLLEGMP